LIQNWYKNVKLKLKFGSDNYVFFISGFEFILKKELNWKSQFGTKTQILETFSTYEVWTSDQPQLKAAAIKTIPQLRKRPNQVTVSTFKKVILFQFFKTILLFTLVFFRVDLSSRFHSEQAHVSLLVNLCLLELCIGAVEPVPEAEPAVACVEPETFIVII
jgi:hypothetical protein